ncbi:MAG TPA: GtrA family protein [Burkholderiales bacterium]|nr:GtrA family protein [Burkholderiales bacterium]
MEKIPFRSVAAESARYFGASAAAFAVDFGIYVGLIRLAGWHYLLAAPAGFAVGLLTIYFLSVRWVFAVRRISDARVEFAVFASIGLLGMAVNEGVLYGAVGHAGLSYELGKVVSAAIVFSMNFALRKLILFTRYRAT